MSAINFFPFGGIAPLLDPDKLPEGAAQIAENVDLRSGSIRFWRKPLKVYDYVKEGVIKSVYRMYNGATSYWCHWTDVVNATRGPVNNLSDFKLYYTGDSAGQGWPKKTNLALATGSTNYPHDYHEMGVPVPASGMSVTPVAGSAVTRFYVVTFINEWGVEGPPSAAASATGANSGTWNLSSIPTAPASPYSASSKWGLAKRRVYRLYTDSTGVATYYFVGEIGDMSTTTLADSLADASLTSRAKLTTIEYGAINSEWLPPPSTMKGLVLGHNGIMAGYYDNVICFSEPYEPEAWPVRYQYKTAHKIVAIIPFGASFIAATEGTPEIFTGQHPRSMARPNVDRADMSAVAPQSGLKTPYGAMVATQNGYAVLGNGAPEHLTDALIGPKKWAQLFNPTTIQAAYWQDRLMMFYQGESSMKGLVIDRKMGAMSSIGGVEAQCLFSDPVNNNLYVGLADGVYQWDADPSNMMQGDWMSRVITLPKPKNFAAYRCDAEYEVLGGNFALEQAQIAMDAQTNADTLALLPARSYDKPDRIYMATGAPFPTGHYMRKSPLDKTAWAPGPNGNVMPTGGSLMIGGQYTTFSGRGLVMQWLAFNAKTGQMQTRKSKTLTDRKDKRLPSGYLSDKVAVRLSGNVPVVSFKAATTSKLLETV